MLLQSNLSIGRHCLPSRAFLAPMSGVTDNAFRRVAAQFGAGLVVSEMVAADQLASGEEEARLRAEGTGLTCSVVQLAGCEAKPMGEGARIAEAAGAHVIDINMGCPAKKVVNGWSGSALMRDLDHACRLIEAVRAAVSIPVTLKMRLGWDDATQNAPELAKRAEDMGLSLITVHGRTRMQFYKGKADWRAVAAVRAATTLPLIVNGDIDSIETARAALAASGADGVMVGRAALGRPWLVGQIGAMLMGQPAPLPKPGDMAEAALAHYHALLESMGIQVGLRHARKHIAAYAEEAARLGADIPASEKAEALQSQDHHAVSAFLAACFQRIPAPYPSWDAAA